MLFFSCFNFALFLKSDVFFPQDQCQDQESLRHPLVSVLACRIYTHNHREDLRS